MSSEAILKRLSEVTYDNFICYFEQHYIKDLSSQKQYECRSHFLEQIKRIAIEHKRLYELKYGIGAYRAGLGKYGALERTPLQIIMGDSNCTRLLMPKTYHSYGIHEAHRTVSPNPRWQHLTPPAAPAA